jgi:hypothetical protein
MGLSQIINQFEIVGFVVPKNNILKQNKIVMILTFIHNAFEVV